MLGMESEAMQQFLIKDSLSPSYEERKNPQ
jgi:hypothetical protein